LNTTRQLADILIPASSCATSSCFAMATKAAHKRLSKEFVAMQREPPPFIWASPDEKNILAWNFLIRGPPDSPFEGGEFHGVLLFPPEYPFKPPGIKMITPSGRFAPDKKICFSMSDFHPGSWNPAWSVATILTGLLSFMLSDEMTTGSVNTTDADKRVYAARSHSWNIQQRKFKEAFPEYSGPSLRDLPNMGETVIRKPSPPPPKSPHITRSSSSSATKPTVPSPTTQPTTAVSSTPSDGNIGSSESGGEGTGGWVELFWQKWRWGLFIAIAVVVSRLSSSA